MEAKQHYIRRCGYHAKAPQPKATSLRYDFVTAKNPTTKYKEEGNALEIIKGKQIKPLKVVIYGPEGVGKSTFASQFPDPIFIDTEGSTNALDVARVIPRNWRELLEATDYFVAHPEEVGTLVIDTADWAEKMCTEKVCMDRHWDGIEDAGYGKGYVYVAEEFSKLLNRLEMLRDAGVNVVLTAHSMLRKFEQPDEMNPYDRWELKLSRKCSPLVKEWSDLMLFINYKTFVMTGGDGKKAKATGGTKRMMYTEHTATYDAKNRHGLKAELPFEYSEIAHIVPTKGECVSTQSSLQQTTITPPVTATTAMATTSATVPPPQPEAHPEGHTAPNSGITLRDGNDPYNGLPQELIERMMTHAIQLPEIQAAVAQKGYYPPEQSVATYDPTFVQGVLIGAWPQVEEIILKNREELPF